MTARQNSQNAASQQPTQECVVDMLLKAGPLSARDIAIRLDMSPAGVRRHLEHLCEIGEAEVVTTSFHSRNHRGRPAKKFQLTRQGRERFGTDYEDLAKEALLELRTVAGDSAIWQFAHTRMKPIFDDIQPVSTAADSAELDRARIQTVKQIVDRFIQAGFATTLEEVGHGVQICQHHCPVAAVAESCPELCQVEEEAIEHLLGTHIQRLSVLSQGHRTCTTNIPLMRSDLPDQEVPPRATTERHRSHPPTDY